jgi:DNA repair exonuclease SbcCD ATPase subunit
MRDVVFQKVYMENYGPYIDPIEIEFKNNNLLMITGPNGVGKTMLLDAIPYALFGTTSKGMSGDDVVNNKIGKNCKVSLNFKVNDEQYNITRYQKYKSYGNTVILKRGKEKIKQGHREVLPVVENLITHRQLFPNTIMFGQKIKDFFTDLQDSQKKAIFRIVLTLDKWAAYYDKAKDKLKDLDANVIKLDTALSMINNSIEDAEESIAKQKELEKAFYQSIKNKIVEIESQIVSSKRLIQSWREQLLKININPPIETLIEKITTVKNSLKDIDDRYNSRLSQLELMKNNKKNEFRERAEEAINKIRDEMSLGKEELKKQLEDIINEREKTALLFIESKNGARRNQDRVENLLFQCENDRDEIKTALNLDVSKCPTCKQEISASSKDHLKLELEGYENKIINYRNQITEYQDEIKSIIKQGEHEIANIDTKAETVKANINSIDYELKKKEAEINEKTQQAFSQIERAAISKAIEINAEKDNENQSLSKELGELQSQLQQAQEKDRERKRIEETITNLLNEKLALEKEIEQLANREFDTTTLKDEISKLDKFKSAKIKLSKEVKATKKMLVVAKFWKDSFSPTGIPSMLIDESIPFMNKRVQHYLDKISNGRYIVSFDTLSETKKGEIRDKISVNFLDTQTKGDKRVQLSGGQTRIVDIATILTLGELQENIQNVKYNILMFDEIFDSLDDENIGRVSKVLRKLVENKTVVVISHRHIDQIEADEVLNING